MENKDILNLLLKLEWCKRRDDGMSECPDCYEGYKYGHKHDCTLANSIKNLGGIVNIQSAPVIIVVPPSLNW